MSSNHRRHPCFQTKSVLFTARALEATVAVASSVCAFHGIIPCGEHEDVCYQSVLPGVVPEVTAEQGNRSFVVLDSWASPFLQHSI